MMILKMIGPDAKIMEEIAVLLIKERLLANATIDAAATFYEMDSKRNAVESKQQFVLSGISKSLLFKKINDLLRSKYGSVMPLLYSEPVIMLDPDHTEEILSKLVKT